MTLEEEIQKRFALFVRNRALSRAWVANEIGVSRDAVQRLVSGKTKTLRVSPETLGKMIRLQDIPPGKFTWGSHT